MNQKGSALIITLVFLLFVSGIVVAYLFGAKSNQLSESGVVRELSDKPTTSTANPTPAPKAGRSYENTEYKFAFNLELGERAVECPNKNENNDNIAVWTSTLTNPPNEFSECARGGTFEAVFAVKKVSDPSLTSVEAYIKSLQQDYQLTQSQITISGKKATRVMGTKTTVSPLPNNIDQVVLMNNGIFYSFSYSYTQRDINILD